MKHLAIHIVFLLLFTGVKAQIENVVVETYYVSDSLDATDTTDGRVLEAGSKTYRIYIDLKTGSSINKIYGDKYHKLKISSSANFYNNINRPNAYFGYLINKAWFPGNPTLALDSWLSLGFATKSHFGVLKTDDTDSSFIGGTKNGGGSSGVAGGLLINANPLAGIPLTSSDGMVPSSGAFTQWIDYGFKDLANVDTSIFGSVNSGQTFESDTAYLKQNSGVRGADSTSNRVLVAQLTTKGDISFELNLEIRNSNGSISKYVANDDTLLANEMVSPFLKYPLACGCKDPNFLEYKNSYSCSFADSCKTRIVYGCRDTMACNYNPNANYNIKFLCCYPGYCNDRDLSLVCPQINNERLSTTNKLILYPNPASETISFEIPSSSAEASCIIYNCFGKEVMVKRIEITSGIAKVDIKQLEKGFYFLRLFTEQKVLSQSFLKN